MGRYISNGQGWTFGIVDEVSDVESLSSQAEEGDSVFCRAIERPCYYSGDIWTNEDCTIVEYHDPTEQPLSYGDVVIVGDELGTMVVEAETTTTANNSRILGVVVWTAGSKLSVAVKGKYKVNTPLAIPLYRKLSTTTTAGQASVLTGIFHTGMFGFAIESVQNPVSVILARKELY